MNLDWNYTEMCSWASTSIGWDNGFAPNRRQAIISTNDGKSTDAYLRHSASMSFKDLSMMLPVIPYLRERYSGLRFLDQAGKIAREKPGK